MNRLQIVIITLILNVVGFFPLVAAEKLQELHGKFWETHLKRVKLQNVYDTHYNMMESLEHPKRVAQNVLKKKQEELARLQAQGPSLGTIFSSGWKSYFEKRSSLINTIEREKSRLEDLEENAIAANQALIDTGCKIASTIKTEHALKKEFNAATTKQPVLASHTAPLSSSSPSLPFISTWKGGLTLFAAATTGYMMWRGGKEGLKCLCTLDFKGFWHAVKTNGKKLPGSRQSQPSMPTSTHGSKPRSSGAQGTSGTHNPKNMTLAQRQAQAVPAHHRKPQGAPAKPLAGVRRAAKPYGR